MTIVPQPFPPVHVHPTANLARSLAPDTATPAPEPVPTRAFEGRRWPCRLYPGDLAHLSAMRQDLHRDLARLSGLDADSADTLVLCASELFANAIHHSRSGDPGGDVIRTLTMPTAATLRVGIIDDGHRANAQPGPGTESGTRFTGPAIPADRTLTEWEEAERGRGLLLVENLSQAWGSRTVLDFPFCEGQGTLLWAEFAFAGPSTTFGEGV